MNTLTPRLVAQFRSLQDYGFNVTVTRSHGRHTMSLVKDCDIPVVYATGPRMGKDVTAHSTQPLPKALTRFFHDCVLPYLKVIHGTARRTHVIFSPVSVVPPARWFQDNAKKERPSDPLRPITVLRPYRISP